MKIKPLFAFIILVVVMQFNFITVAYCIENESDDNTEVADTTTQTVSQLTMPNAFSPNGDGHNDFYKPKTAQNIVEFRAIIFNRWGQKLYEWNDVNGDGWDGTFNGKKVKDGAYYVNVKAKGSDGQTFTIKKDVNVLTVIPSEDANSY